jgi:hypothetical protein
MLYRVAALCFYWTKRNCVSPLFEIALLLMRVDHVSSSIVNANHAIM